MRWTASGRARCPCLKATGPCGACPMMRQEHDDHTRSQRKSGPRELAIECSPYRCREAADWNSVLPFARYRDAGSGDAPAPAQDLWIREEAGSGPPPRAELNRGLKCPPISAPARRPRQDGQAERERHAEQPVPTPETPLQSCAPHPPRTTRSVPGTPRRAFRTCASFRRRQTLRP